MGADFVFTTIIINENKSLPGLKQQLHQRCRKLTMADFTNPDIDLITDEFELDINKQNMPNIISLFENVIDDAFEAMDSREASCMTFMGYHIYITGGMSWGDVPCEAYRDFDRFNYLPECLLELLK